jgi:hypothetical protein
LRGLNLYWRQARYEEKAAILAARWSQALPLLLHGNQLADKVFSIFPIYRGQNDERGSAVKIQ